MHDSLLLHLGLHEKFHFNRLMPSARSRARRLIAAPTMPYSLRQAITRSCTHIKGSSTRMTSTQRPDPRHSLQLDNTVDIRTMSETSALPPRYYQYVATQSRVSDWVSQTHSSQHGGRKAHSRRGSTSANDRIFSVSRSASRRHSPTSRKTSRDGAYPPMPLKGTEMDPLPPAIALISSSLVVCALLPSLLAVSLFVALLTLASLYSQVNPF